MPSFFPFCGEIFGPKKFYPKLLKNFFFLDVKKIFHTRCCRRRRRRRPSTGSHKKKNLVYLCRENFSIRKKIGTTKNKNFGENWKFCHFRKSSWFFCGELFSPEWDSKLSFLKWASEEESPHQRGKQFFSKSQAGAFMSRAQEWEKDPWAWAFHQAWA